MTDTELVPPSVKNIVTTMVVRQAVTAASALLVARGISDPTDATALASAAVGVAGVGVTLAWTTVRAYATKRNWFRALDAKPPSAHK